MKVTYNSQEDKLRILFSEAAIQTSETHPNGLIMDYGQQGRIIGIELPSASEHLSRPYAVDAAGLVESTAPMESAAEFTGGR
ncbi:MAG: DUF2283 domain-containing protein [Armatimonadota bacterium]